jgi:hypothetical protein
MFKKIVTLFFVLLLIALCSEATLAVDDRIMFGIKVSQETVGATEDVLGGSYLSLSPLISLNDKFSLNLKYSTNLAPETFTDHLLMINPQINFIRKRQIGSSGGDQSYLGICYLKTVSNEYFGLTYCILCMGRGTTSSSQALLDMVPLPYLY